LADRISIGKRMGNEQALIEPIAESDREAAPPLGLIATVDDYDSLLSAIRTCLRSSIESGEVLPLGHLSKTVAPKRF
jgi:hypothetical protein